MGDAAPHEIRGWTRSGWRARAGRGVGAAFAVALCLAFDPLGSVGVYGGEVMDVDPSAPKVFEMNMTNPFHPTQSLSFAHVLFLGFSLTYADSAGLRGYIAQDLVQLGRYYAKTKFGCIRHCASADFDGIDGILGLGMPDAALASIPEPLLFAISDETGDPANQYILNRRIFTIVSTDEAAELHLGGFDPHSAVGPMTFVKTTSQAEYSVPVTSIRMGGTEVLNFGSAAQAAGRSDLPGILDSGTSCLVLPDTTLNGQLEQAPYTKLMSVMQRGEPLYVTIGGQQFEIPFSSWWLYPNDRPCIQRTPAGFQGILLGDVLFRSLAVMFDLSHPAQPVIGLAPRNPAYKLVDGECGHVNDFKGCVSFGGGGHKLPMKKRRLAKPETKQEVEVQQLSWLRRKALGEKSHGGFPQLDPSGGDNLLTKVPVDFYEQTQYFVNVSIGTPRQTRTVILDTGSSVFAVFCDKPPSKRSSVNSHIYLPHFIPAMAQRALFSASARPRGFAHGHDEGYEAPAIALVLVAACMLLISVRVARRRAAAQPCAVMPEC